MHQSILAVPAALMGAVMGAAPVISRAAQDQAETVVVSATRIATAQSHLASSVTVISAEDIAVAQQRTLPEVLRNVPGLHLVQAGGPGSQTSVFMRGTDSNHTKVLVDGMDMADPSNPNAAFQFGQFLTDDIDRVEVLRGPQSGLYGSDAIGGVINVITRSGSGPAQLSGSLEGGSFETFNQSGALRGSQGGFHYSANLEHFHSGSTPVTPLELLAPGEARINDYSDNRTASTRLGLDVTRNFDLGLVARYTDTHLRVTGEDFSTFPSRPAAQQSLNATTGYFARASAHLSSFAGFLDQNLGLAYTRHRSADVEPCSAETRNTGQRTKVDWQGALRFSPGATLLLGAEHARDAISEPIAASIHSDSGYAQLQSQLAGQWFAALNLRYDDNSRFGSKLTYRVAPVYVIESSGTKLKASLGTGFKAPSLSELFQDFAPFFYANPRLKPESSTGFDVGIEQGWAQNSGRVGMTYFHNRIRSLITTDATGTTYANVGRATTQGIESFISYRPLRALTLRADYTYTQATDDALNRELLRRPKHKGRLAADWQVSSTLSIHASVLALGAWIDGNRDFSIPRLRAPGYTVANLAAAFEVGHGYCVYGRIDNLFDRRYQSPVGFLQPSLGVYAGIRAKL